jgi:ABC-type Fe3+ transport system substrate-binding protein
MVSVQAPCDTGGALALQFSYLGVPRNATHPHLAKLFVNAVLSELGQRILDEVDVADHPELPGSQTAAEFSDLKARGGRPWQ